MTEISSGSGSLGLVSEELAQVVDRVASSVVRISARRGVPASGVVWQADGLILTADHVLEREEEISVGLPDGAEGTAAVVGRDRASDLALLRVDRGGLRPLEHAGLPRPGHLALAVGRPGSDGPRSSLGIVSGVEGLSRRWRQGAPDKLILTDVVLYPGFSGGPLVDTAGRLLGINTSLFARGVSPAVPAETAAQVAQALLKQGRIPRGYLGVACQPVALPGGLRQRLQLSQETGLIVVGLDPEGPAERGGILLGDILLALGGREVHDPADLFRGLDPEAVGRDTALRIVRGGAVQECRVTIGERR